jgi:hypothetical protein
MARARVATFLAETKALHGCFVRREGSPVETQRQALFLLSETLDVIKFSNFEQSDLVPFATYAAALYPANDVATATAKRLAEVYSTAITDPMLQQDGRLMSRTAELCLQFMSTHRETFHATLARAYANGVRNMTNLQDTDSFTAAECEALLRAASVLYAPKSDFSFHGSGAAALLPRKTKMHMDIALQRCDHSHRLLQVLRTVPFTRIDAIRLINTIGSTGLYDEQVVRRCCETVDRTVAGATARDIARITYNLGVMGHKHENQSVLCQHVDTRDLSPRDFKDFLMGIAMLHSSPKTLRITRAVEDGLWLHGMKNPPFAWHVDVLHSLSVVNFKVPKFTAHACRSVITDIHKMTDEQRLKLLYAVGAKKDWQVTKDMETSWRKVDRIREVLVTKVQEISNGAKQPIARDALACAGYPVPIPLYYADCLGDMVHNKPTSAHTCNLHRSMANIKKKKNPKKLKKQQREKTRKLTQEGKLKQKKGDMKVTRSRNVGFVVKQKKGGQWIKSGERQCKIHTVCDCVRRTDPSKLRKIFNR